MTTDWRRLLGGVTGEESVTIILSDLPIVKVIHSMIQAIFSIANYFGGQEHCDIPWQ